MGTLFFDYARCIKETNPKICIIENVEGLVRHDKGRTLKTIVNILEKELHYHVQYKVLNAVDYGVAQKRKEYFL